MIQCLSHPRSVCSSCPRLVSYLKSVMGSVLLQTARVPLSLVLTRCCCTMSSQKHLVPPPASLLRPLSVPDRLLLGPGPSNVPPRILSACGRQLIGHVHTEMIQVRSIVPTIILIVITKDFYKLLLLS